eukprot:15072071-Ditylum_brightwellii.AAC.1
MERVVKKKTNSSSSNKKDTGGNKKNDSKAGSELEFYSAAQIWSSDGTRAGNVRAIIPPSQSPPKEPHAYNKMKPTFLSSGLSSVDMEPVTITLDNLETPEIKCGVIVGFNDIERPEQARYLARKGIDLLVVSSLGGKAKELIHEGLTVANHVIPTRAMENSVFVAYAAYEGDEDSYGGYFPEIPRSSHVGSSSIVAPDGSFLIKGPSCFCGEMPPTEGYVLPCGGLDSSASALYAADVSLKEQMFVQRKMTNNPREDGSLEHWDLVPHKEGIQNKWLDMEKKSDSGSTSQFHVVSSNERNVDSGRHIKEKKEVDSPPSVLSSIAKDKAAAKLKISIGKKEFDSKSVKESRDRQLVDMLLRRGGTFNMENKVNM